MKLQMNDVVANSVVVNKDMEVKGNLDVGGDLRVDGNITVSGAIITTETKTVIEEEKLVCRKCGGTKFTPTGHGIVFTVYIENGTPPSEKEYKCSNCGNLERVRYPAVYNVTEPKEIILPKKTK